MFENRLFSIVKHAYFKCSIFLFWSQMVFIKANQFYNLTELPNVMQLAHFPSNNSSKSNSDNSDLSQTNWSNFKQHIFKHIYLIFIVIYFQNRHAEMLNYYRRLLTYIKSAVTKNYSEKSINSILDYISTSKQMDLLQIFYETTLDALKVSQIIAVALTIGWCHSFVIQ